MQKKYSTINSKSNHNSSIIGNSLFFVAYKVLNIVFPLITSVYVARILLPTGTGQVAYAQNIATYFTLIAALGLPTYGTREIAKKYRTDDYYNTFWELYIVNFFSTTICVIGYYSLCFLSPVFKEELALHLIVGLSIIFNYFNVDWLYQGREEYKYISIRGMVIKTLSVLLLFLFVKEEKDYLIYAGITCFITGGNNLINMIGLPNRINKPTGRLAIKKHYKPILILFVTNVAIEVYTLLDTTMLGALCANDVVGYYTYAMKTTKVVIVVLTAATTVLLPKLSDYFASGNFKKYSNLIEKGLAFCLVTTIPSAILMCINSDLIIKILYGANYIPAIGTMRLLSILIVPITFSTFLGIQVLCSSNHEDIMLKAVVVGAILNIIFNTYFIPRFMQEGAAVASVSSEVAVALFEIIVVLKIMKFNINKKLILTTILAGLVMAVALLIVRVASLGNLIELLLSSAVAFLVYASVLGGTNFTSVRKIMKNLRRHN